MNPPLDRQFLEAQPGHCIRRLHQIAVALFMEETTGSAVTPVQFAAMTAVHDQPGLDQRTLAASIAFDTSTIGGVIDRLEKRGLMLRRTSPSDRRVRLLELTPEGEALLQTLVPAVLKTQERLLAPLPAEQRALFSELLQAAVQGHTGCAPASSDD
jgi:DNA-binding MarR family transcriptional regulator